MIDYYNKKDDEGKQKALFPKEVLPAILENKSPYARLLNDLPLDISSIIANTEMVLQYGKDKYSANSWQTVEDAEERYWSAYIRHLMAGGGKDEESGITHKSHALCNLVFLLWFEINRENLNLSERIAALTNEEIIGVKIMQQGCIPIKQNEVDMSLENEVKSLLDSYGIDDELTRQLMTKDLVLIFKDFLDTEEKQCVK